MHCADFLTQFYAYNDINNLQKLILIQQHQQNMPRWQMTVKYILKSKQCQQSTTTHRQAMKREVLDDCNEYKIKYLTKIGNITPNIGVARLPVCTGYVSKTKWTSRVAK